MRYFPLRYVLALLAFDLLQYARYRRSPYRRNVHTIPHRGDIVRDSARPMRGN